MLAPSFKSCKSLSWEKGFGEKKIEASLNTWFLHQFVWNCICDSWGFAPSQLVIARELLIFGRTLGSLYYINLDFLVKNSSWPLCLLGRGKEVEETLTFVVILTTRTHALLSGVAKPQDKSLCSACLLLLWLFGITFFGCLLPPQAIS